MIRFVLLFLISISVSALEITGGRYTVEVDGVEQDGYFLQYHTALAEAVRQAQRCRCTTVVNQPSITVRVDPLRLRISWENMSGASQYQLQVGDRMMQFDSDITSITSTAKVGDELRVRYSNPQGEWSEWSDPNVVEIQ